MKGLPLSEAVIRYETIIAAGKTYPEPLRTIGNAGMATGIVMLYTDSPTNILLTFGAACLVDILLRLVASRKIPPFFAQAAAALFIIIIASTFAALGQADIWPFVGVNPAVVSVGCIMVLVAGLTLAATAQDAIDEYYVTASARLVKTSMMTIGIIIGIIGGLTIVNEISTVAINTRTAPGISPYFVQLLGAAIAGASWALHTQSSRAAIAWASLISVGGYMLYAALSPTGTAIASGIASFGIGFAACLVARFFKSPSIAIINAAIIILVPGYMLYRGLMHFVGTPSSDDFTNGLMIVTTAIMVALAISAGAALGVYAGRPFRSHLVRIYSYAPQLFTPIRKKRRVK